MNPIETSMRSTHVAFSEDSAEKNGAKTVQAQMRDSVEVTSHASSLEKLAQAKMQQEKVSCELQKMMEVHAPGLEVTKNAGRFHTAIIAAKEAGKQQDIDNESFGTKKSKWYGAFVYTYPEKEYNEMKMLLQQGDAAGVAVKKSRDIVSVFKHPSNKTKGVGALLIEEAIKQGGTHLDCFNGFLPRLYSLHGLVPVSKLQFDRQYAPDDWNYERDGEPDIIFMAYNEALAENPEKDDHVRDLWINEMIARLDYSPSLDEAKKAQEEYLWLRDIGQ